MHCNPSSNQIKKGPLYYITVAIIIIDLWRVTNILDTFSKK